MTVKELIEKLSEFPSNFIVMIPNADYDWTDTENYMPYDVPVTSVVSGFNELDSCVFLGNYEEDK